LGNLAGNLSLPGNLPVNISNVPTVEEGERIFEEKCKKMGHREAYQAAQVYVYQTVRRVKHLFCCTYIYIFRLLMAAF
jgi:hypothetical protein